MYLRWIDQEVVTIPDVGQVRPGVEFTIDDQRGVDLVQRKVAEVVQISPPMEEINKKVKTMVQKDDARPVKEQANG